MEEIIDALILSLPPLGTDGVLVVGEDTILVTAGGFEDRAFAAARAIAPGAQGNALVLNYKPFNDENRLYEIVNVLVEKGLTIRDEDVLVFDRYDPEQFPRDLESRIIALNPASIILDVSAMSKLALLLCLQVCWHLDLDTTLFYAEATEKGPSFEEFENARLTNILYRPTIQVYTGIHGVIRVTELSSVAMQGQPTAAIAFMSFNESLTQALLDSVYPSRLFLINGKSPNWPWREEAMAWIHEQLRNEWPSQDNPISPQSEVNPKLPIRSASTLEYRDTISIVLKLYWRLAVDHRILLAPTGSKMQTVGCFFAKALHPDIHIEYPTPEGFLGTYSSGIGQTWQIHFGKLSRLIGAMSAKERRAMLSLPPMKPSLIQQITKTD